MDVLERARMISITILSFFHNWTNDEASLHGSFDPLPDCLETTRYSFYPFYPAVIIATLLCHNAKCYNNKLKKQNECISELLI